MEKKRKWVGVGRSVMGGWVMGDVMVRFWVGWVMGRFWVGRGKGEVVGG